jgi:hypothetical protein
MRLEEVNDAYRRLRSALTRSAETAIEYGLPNLDQVEADLRVLEAGIFVLLFGVLEQSLRSLAERRSSDARVKAKMTARELSLDRVLKQLKLEPEISREIVEMDTIRNDGAHGERLAQTFDIPAIVDRIKKIQAEI